VVTIDLNRIYIKICLILKYEIEENMCIMFDLSNITKLLVDWRQMQDVETRKQRVPNLMNIVNFEQHLYCNENDTLVEGITKNNVLRIEIKSNYFLQQYQAL